MLPRQIYIHRLINLVENFQSFQVDMLLDVRLDTDVNGKYALIFDSILKSSALALDRNQRARVFNRVLENLLEGTSIHLQRPAMHLKLLVDYLARPNKSFNLIQHPSGLPKNIADIGHPKSALVRITEILNGTRDPDAEAADLLILLIRRVLEWVFALALWFDGLISVIGTNYQETTKHNVVLTLHGIIKICFLPSILRSSAMGLTRWY